ncbi:MAG: hypothetical protein CL681_00895 [Blastopirellula sp.]|nr:hypothetical protein [Blastopirellula sp.]
MSSENENPITPSDAEGTADTDVDNSPPVETDDESLLQAIDNLDYSKYEKPELRASIESMLSVFGTLKSFFSVLGCTFPTSFTFIVWLFSDRGWLTILACVVGSAIVSFIIATLLAITLATRRILNETTKVIDLTLEIVADVLQDLGATQDRGMLQTIALVFGGVSRNLVLPIVESVVSSQLGCIGWPVLLLYRRTFAKAVDYATNRLLYVSHKIISPVTQSTEGAANQLTAHVQSGAEMVDWLFQNVRPYVITGSRSVTWGILVPLWCLFFLTVSGFGVLIGTALWLT